MEQRDGIRKVYRPSWSWDNLFGEMRYMLKPEQRSVWNDLLDMAKLCRPAGTVAPEPGKAYTVEALAHIFNVQEELLAATLKVLEENKKITNNGSGIQIVEWNKKYRSEYERQKEYRDNKAEKSKFENQKNNHMVKK